MTIERTWKPVRTACAFAPALLLFAATAFGWSFGVCGDSRDDPHGVFPRILSAVDASDMEFLIHTGDLETDGSPPAWEKFRKKTAGFSKPLRLVIGNHEVRKSNAAEFARFFGLPAPSYGFRHKDAYFVVLDNGGGALSAQLLSWLERELAAHPRGKAGIDHLVVAMHIPPRTDTIFPHGTSSDYGEQSERLLEILERHRVELVLASHEHLHAVESWSDITVIVSGGAGARMFPLQSFGFYRIDVSRDGFRESFIRIPKEAPRR